MARTTKKAEITKNILIKKCPDIFDVYISYNGDRDYFTIKRDDFNLSAAKVKELIKNKSSFDLTKEEINFIYKHMKDVIDKEEIEHNEVLD